MLTLENLAYKSSCCYDFFPKQIFVQFGLQMTNLLITVHFSELIVFSIITFTQTCTLMQVLSCMRNLALTVPSNSCLLVFPSHGCTLNPSPSHPSPLPLSLLFPHPLISPLRRPGNSLWLKASLQQPH